MDFAANSAAKAAKRAYLRGASGPVLRYARERRPPVIALQLQGCLRSALNPPSVEIPGLLLVLADDLHQFFAQRRVPFARGQGPELRSVFPVVRRPLARRLPLPPAVPDIGFP